MNMRTMIVALICVATAHAQQDAEMELRLVRTANQTSTTVSTGATAAQTIVLPAAAASAAGKGLKITAVSGETMTLDWDTPSASLVGTSAQLAADAEDVTAYSSGPVIAVVANKKYRIVGFFRMKRGTSGSNDDFYLRLNTPATTTYKYVVECYDCPANTSINPRFVGGTTAATGTLATDVIAVDPAGDMAGFTYQYRIEGVLLVSTSGNVRLTFNKIGASGNVVMLAGSFWALQEIE